MKDLNAVLKSLSLPQLKALHRCCKTRARAFFRHPKDVIALRNEIDRREGFIERAALTAAETYVSAISGKPNRRIRKVA